MYPRQLIPFATATSRSEKASWNPCEQEDMVGKRLLHGKDLKPAANKQFAAVRSIKNMMVQTAVVEIVKRPPVKLLHRSRPGIKTEIVFLQDLRQMKEVVFRSVFTKVLKHVVDCRWRSSMVEGSEIIR